MFRKMRRHKQLLPEEKTIAILEKGTDGVLAVCGDEGYPYTVPLNYIYKDSKIYFHCAMAGHKLDAISQNSKVSFCVIDKNRIVPEKFTTYFRSAVVFGKAEVLTDPKEILDSLDALAAKYSPDESAERRKTAIEKELKHLCMVGITIDHMTGKEAIELVKK